MYNNRKNPSTLEKEDEVRARAHAKNISKNWDSLMSFKERTPRPLRGSSYEAPEMVEVEDPAVIAKVGYVEEADFKPSTTTMQFKDTKDNDVYEDVKHTNKKHALENKRYGIDTKGKMLIAVYAVVVLTIFSLIILNSKMLKNLDNTIENYSSQVEMLNEQYTEVLNELDHAMSDEEVIKKATEMGMENA